MDIFIAVYMQTKSTKTQPRVNSFAVFSVVRFGHRNGRKLKAKVSKLGKIRPREQPFRFWQTRTRPACVSQVSVTSFSILHWETASQHVCVLLSSNRKQKSTSVANILIRQPHEACKSKYMRIFSPTCVFAGSHFKRNIL